MQYVIEGKGKVSLTQNDFIATGGEAIIFGKGGYIYKIFHDPKDMIPLDKISELSILDRPNILKPLDIIRNKDDIIVGFTMQWIKDTVPLCKLFTNDFRYLNGVTPQSTLKLVEHLINDTHFIHEKGCLIVDANEFNFLVDHKTLITPFFIDTNAYKTPSFSASAIMPSIRDYHTEPKDFNELTDWFSLGIITFQLFIGIHPFKGNHKNFPKKKYKGTAELLKHRILANISVINKDTSVPATTRDFSLIPTEYFKWYTNMFEKGERLPPPTVSGMIKITPVRVEVVSATDNFIINLIKEYEAPITKVYTYNRRQVILTKDKLYIDKVDYPSTDPDLDVIFSPGGTPLVVQIKDDFLTLTNINTKEQHKSVKAKRKTILDNTLYVQNGENFIEISVSELTNGKIIPSVKTTWKVLPHATTLYEGVIYQNLLGKPHLQIPFKRSGAKLTSCMIRHFPELEGYNIIDAKQREGICIILGHKDTKYDKLIFRFSDDYKTHECRVESDVDLAPINFVTLANGITIHFIDDNTIEIFSRTSDKVKRIQDPDINSDMTLYLNGVNVGFFKDTKLFSFKMK